MSDRNNNSLNEMVIGASLAALFLIPVLSPRVFLFIGKHIWGWIYLFVAIRSLFFDPTSELPWFRNDPYWFLMLNLTIIGGAIGASRDKETALAMLTYWGGILLFPTWLAILGVGIPNDWNTYKTKNYTEITCRYVIKKGEEKGAEHCLYAAQPGKKIPNFIEDVDHHKIKYVFKYTEK